MTPWILILLLKSVESFSIKNKIERREIHRIRIEMTLSAFRFRDSEIGIVPEGHLNRENVRTKIKYLFVDTVDVCNCNFLFIVNSQAEYHDRSLVCKFILVKVWVETVTKLHMFVQFHIFVNDSFLFLNIIISFVPNISIIHRLSKRGNEN